MTSCAHAARIPPSLRSPNWRTALAETVCLYPSLVANLVHKENHNLTVHMCIVDFESFVKVLNRPNGFRDPGEAEEYCRGFQVFDKDMTGFIGVGQLRYSMYYDDRTWYKTTEMLTGTVLTNLGEKMSDEEVDELLKAVDTSSGEINYTGKLRNSQAQSSGPN